MLTKPDTRLEKLQFFHFRFRDTGMIIPTGGITVCYRPGDSRGYLASAVCSMKDTYCKKLGRIRAEGRTHSGHYVVVIDKPVNYEELVVIVKKYAFEVLDKMSDSTGIADVYSCMMATNTTVDFVLHTRHKE